jgi:hypothetical protein
MPLMHGTGHIVTSKQEVGVRLCGCGGAHVSFGAVVINVSPSLLPHLAEIFAAAAREHRLADEARAAETGSVLRFPGWD